jgi:hypothetical protein
MAVITYISLTDDSLFADQSTESNLMGYAWRNCEARATWEGCVLFVMYRAATHSIRKLKKGIQNVFFLTYNKATNYKTENTAVGIRHADHGSPSIRKSWR